MRLICSKSYRKHTDREGNYVQITQAWDHLYPMEFTGIVMIYT